METSRGRSLASQPEATHLLRLEGANLSRFVFDTRDLSTVRGASLLLLDAANRRCSMLLEQSGAQSVRQISGGASVGLFEFALPPAIKAEAVRSSVENSFRADPQLRHATFLVDVVPMTDFAESAEGAIAANRWRQLAASSIAVPPTNIESRDAAESTCEKDGLRPRMAAGAPTLSEATWARRKYGLQQKQSFYVEWTRIEGERDLEFDRLFANDFGEIAAPVAESALSNKLAVFYADGNRFGSIERSLSSSVSRANAWDVFLRSLRRDWLRGFLASELLPNVGGRWHDHGEGGCYRFETLLWGGDEVMFVMPAANGWRFAQNFFQAVERWNARDALDENEVPLAENPLRLTHTAALVFCHRSAPIHSIRALASEQMAGFAKEITARTSSGDAENVGRKRNQLVYQVLESFDHVGGSYEGSLRRRFPSNSFEPGELVFTEGVEGSPALSRRLEIVGAAVDALHELEFPRSQLRTLASSLVGADDARTAATLKRNLATFARGSDALEIRQAMMALRSCCASDLAFWLHLEELWDYARP